MKQKQSILSIIFGMCIMLSFFYACETESIANQDEIPLRFSLDTLTFDTVFTTVGSATRSFKIYNDLDEAVIINRVYLRNNSSSKFRINVDGIQGPLSENIRIEPNDSIYVFAEVTVNPDDPLSISPFVIEEFLDISVNQSAYEILFQAWGQNANYVPSRDSKGTVNLFTCDFNTWEWNDPRPYVIYGVLVVDSCDLVIPAGTEVYVHGGIAINELGIFNDGLLAILGDASIQVNGTPDEPVTFRSDRLEENFSETAGQWSGILISQNSKGNSIRNAQIAHAITGITIDSASSLTLVNTSIAHTAGFGINAAHASLSAENVLIYDTGSSGINISYGGSYTLAFCTVANFNNQNAALDIDNFRCYDEDCIDIRVNPFLGFFNNCIFVGNDEDEIAFFDATDRTSNQAFNFQLRNCIVQVDELLEADRYPNFFDNCTDCKNYQREDTLFRNIDENNFLLDTLSIAIDMATSIDFVTQDIRGLPRESGLQDIGCYEFQK